MKYLYTDKKNVTPGYLQNFRPATLSTIFLVFCLVNSSFGQTCPPDIKWAKALGGTQNDYALSVQQTDSGGFIVAGYSDSFNGDVFDHIGGNDFWVVNLDSAGSIIWTRSLGGSLDDRAFSVQQTTDGGFIVVGTTESSDFDVTVNKGGADVWVVKLTSSGDISWQKSFGGALEDKANAVEQTLDGGYIVAGFSSSVDGDVTGNHGDKDFWILKLDAVGNLSWEKSLGGSSGESAYAIHQAFDAGYIIAGYTSSDDGDVTDHIGNEDYWIVKLDPSGILQWEKTYGGSQTDIAQSVTQITSGGYIVAGTSFSTDIDISGNLGGSDLWIVNLDGLGSLSWQKSLGGTEDDGANSVQITSDGGFIIAGYASSDDGDISLNHGATDYWLVKLDALQNIDWEKTLGGSDGDFASAVRQNANGGFVIVGRTESSNGDVSGNNGASDYWIARLDTGLTTFTYYVDLDGDGYGNAADTITSDFCIPPLGYVVDSADCNDTNSVIHPFVAAIQWQEALGGTDDDFAYDIQQATDGGFIVAGSSRSNDDDVSGNHGSTDYWIMKLDPSGILDWQKSLGGSGSETAFSVYQTSDNGFVVAGNTSSTDGDVSGNHGLNDYWIVKLDQNGSVVWKKCFGGPGADNATSVQQTGDGGFIVAGYSSSESGDITNNHGGTDYWIVKLDGSGNLSWQKSLGGSDEDLATSIRQTTDGGYIVAGYSNSNDLDVSGNQGVSDYWIVKLDPSGNISWQKSYGGTDWEIAHKIQQTADGGYIVAGQAWSNNGNVSGNHGQYDYWILKLNSSGDLQWQKCAGGSDWDEARAVHQTIDGGFIIAGDTWSVDGDVEGNHGLSDYWIVKLDQTGNISWKKCFGGSSTEGSSYRGSFMNCGIRQTTDAGFILGGFSASHDDDVSGNHGGADYWVAKLNSEVFEVLNGVDDNCNGAIDEGITGIQPSASGDFLVSLFPNPNNGMATISLTLPYSSPISIKVFDLAGRELLSMQEEHPGVSFSHSFNLYRFPQGTYLAQVVIDGNVKVLKWVIGL